MAFLSPLDLLQVPDQEQDIIRCLVRRPQLSAQEIASHTKIPLNEIKTLLLKMVKNAQIDKSEKENKEVFIAKIGGKEKKPASKGDSLLDSLFS